MNMGTFLGVSVGLIVENAVLFVVAAFVARPFLRNIPYIGPAFLVKVFPKGRD